ncbi:MAG TPA: UDP-N-acetylglucosamine 2-epimerase, partial [Dissulfurispiraceae bacterium]
EGIPDEKIHFVGNVMIDTLLRYREKAEQSGVLHRLGLAAGNPGTRGTASKYAVLTLHRPSNVDSKANFTEIADALQRISKQVPIIFPVHPRTLKHIREFGLESSFHFIPDGDQSKVRENAVNCIGPLGYLEFLHLMARSSLVLTDSGGIQEETTILGVPCVTIRDNTERPVTVTCGTNRLAGTKKEAIVCEGLRALRNRTTRNAIPPLWDGRAAKRITGILLEALAGEGKR